jgi:hypothetical protein
MNVVFLSPHFPPEWHRFAVALRDAGARVLGIADRAWDELPEGLRGALAEYYRVDDLHHYDELVRAMGWFIHRHGRVDRIESLNEYWLETEAALRTDFNVPGPRLEDVPATKRKSLMKAAFRRAGLEVPPGRVCRTSEEARAFAREVGYPLIAKPDIGVGAARTYRIDSDADLDDFLADRPPVDHILERFIDGRLVSFDGLVDRDGRLVFTSSLVYSTGVLESVMGAEIHYHVPREIPADLAEAGRRVVEAFGLRERAFHFEFFRLPDGSLVGLEVNIRPPGGLTVDMWDYANDIDFYRAWAEVVVHGSADLTQRRPYHCLFAGRKPGRRYALSHEEVLDLFGGLVVHHQPIESAFAVALGAYGYLLRSPELEPLLDAARTIQRHA